MHPAFKAYLAEKKTSHYKGGKRRDELAHKGPIYKLNSNENVLGSSPKALDAIHAQSQMLHEYPERTGKSLHNTLSHHYNNKLEPEQFIIANGGVGIIELIAHAFLEKGVEAITTTPSFGAYTELSKNTGSTIVNVPLCSNQYTLDVAGVLKSVTDNTRLIWLCSPNNPTGTYISKNQIDTLVAQLPPHVIIVYDEVYNQFATAPDYTTALPYVLAGKNIIGINSFSKVYGLAGMRIGYAYSTPEIAQYINKIKRPFLVNSLALAAAKAALSDIPFVQKTLETVHQGKIFLYSKLDEMGVQYWKSEANFILIKPTIADTTLVEKMAQHGIMIRPVARFGATGCVRVTIGTREANEIFIHALQKALST